MREIRQSGSEGGGNEQTVSPYPYLSFSFSFFYIFFLPPTPNPLPSGKRALRFASPDFNLHHFFLSLIDMSLFKDRGVAMGKPHCNSSICSGL